MAGRLAVKQCKAVPNMTFSALQQHLASRSPQPLKLPGLITMWPAFNDWRLSDDLKPLREAVGEHREVEIELGRKGRGYLDPEWQRVSMGFGLFLDAFILSKIPSTTESLPAGYLAQSDLLDSAPELMRFVPELPHFKAGPKSTVYRRTIWIGPGGSFTPFHRDPYIGLYTQVLGTKTFHLLPPSAEELLDISPISRHKNTSQIPIPVSQLSSTLQPIAELQGACEANLRPGDSVLVPEGWFHSAEGGAGPGIGVGAWFR